MAVRRLWYLVALLGCWVFYIAYGEWFSWLLLLAVLGLPWLSLVLSLPAIHQLQLSPAGPDWIPLGEQAELLILGSCNAPLPPFRGKIRMMNCLDGETALYDPTTGFTAHHCGGILCTVEKPRVYDYLGLFSFRVRRLQSKTIPVRPKSLAIREPEELHRHTAQVWKPKFGGGFAENHELRLYRPGDNLNQVHWKLSAKTGKLILREPMEPQRGLLLLTMTLRGSPDELDRKFGRLQWLGNYLLERNLPYELRVLTGKGLEGFSIRHAQDLQKTVDQLLCTPMAEAGSIRERTFAAAWQHHIGGAPDED